MLFWHRRSGKDDICLHRTAVAAFERVGTYWHMLPEAEQARKAIWDAVNPHTGLRRIDEAFPPEIRESTNSQGMFIRFKNGSTWQVVGSDNFNSLIGSPPIGVVFSEWAVANPHSWAYLRPILAENGGWALFVTTVRGRNHAYKMYAGAKDDPTWFTQVLRADETNVFTAEALEREKVEYTRDYGEVYGEALFRQEYLCSFDAAIPGAYYANLIEAAERDGRITEVPYDPMLPVNTAWDLGMSDDTAIVFWQVLKGGSVRIIDYYASAGMGLDHYAAVLDKRGYKYGRHFGPHDLAVRELGTGKSRVDVARALGIDFRVLPALKVEDGVNALRLLLPRCWFNARKTEHLLEALRQYRVKRDEKRDVNLGPLHDWTSHAADAMRYMAIALRDDEGPMKKINYPSHPYA